MYEFIEVAGAQQGDYLSSVAMIFNNKLLEDELVGYNTIKVAGRETIGVELIGEDVKEGKLTIDERLPHREITITYKLHADNGTDLQDKFKRLRRLLTTDREIPVRFIDEPESVYFGRLGAMDSVPDDRNNVISTYTIHCDSPYKYSQKITTNGEVDIDTFYKTLPERIELVVSGNKNKIKITNGDYEISASGTFSEGAKVEFIFSKEEVKMLVDNTESTYMIDLQSDLENFYLQQGQMIISDHGEIKVDMRERWL